MACRSLLIKSFTLLLILFLAGCSQMLQSPVQVESDIEEARETYAQGNPDDPLLPLILEQKIQKGMSPAEVFYSWGRPVHRFKGEDRQNWIYEFSDDGSPDSQPKTITHLFFERNVLVRWKHDRRYVYFGENDPGADIVDEMGDLTMPGSSESKKP